MPVGATAKAVKSVSGEEGEAGTKLTDDPGIGSRWPDGALNPSTCPEKLSTKNHSKAVGASRRIQRPIGPPGADSRIVSELRAGLSLSPTNAFDRLRGRTHRHVPCCHCLHSSGTGHAGNCEHRVRWSDFGDATNRTGGQRLQNGHCIARSDRYFRRIFDYSILYAAKQCSAGWSCSPN